MKKQMTKMVRISLVDRTTVADRLHRTAIEPGQEGKTTTEPPSPTTPQNLASRPKQFQTMARRDRNSTA